MNSCSEYQISGFIRKVESLNSKQIVLELQPNSEILTELCAFCNVSNNLDINPKNTTHSHEIKGSLLINSANNHLIFTLGNDDKENSQTNLPHTNVFVDEEKSIPQSVNIDKITNQPSALQYEVDGKVYALKTTFPKKKSHQTRLFQTNEKLNNLSKPAKLHVEDKTFSVMKINTKPFEEAYRISEEEQQAMHRSLELLQVYWECFFNALDTYQFDKFIRSNWWISVWFLIKLCAVLILQHF